jgi:hypothetical protein
MGENLRLTSDGIEIPAGTLGALLALVDKKPEQPSSWLSSLDFYKIVGGGICAVIGGLWTVHLYLDADWKESASAITNVSRSIDEISFFCTGDSAALNIKQFGNLLVGRLTVKKTDGQYVEPDVGVVPALCGKAVFEVRQNLAVARTRVFAPWDVASKTWEKDWSEIDVAVRKITDNGIGTGGTYLKELQRAWKTLLAHKGLNAP